MASEQTDANTKDEEFKMDVRVFRNTLVEARFGVRPYLLLFVGV